MGNSNRKKVAQGESLKGNKKMRKTSQNRRPGNQQKREQKGD